MLAECLADAGAMGAALRWGQCQRPILGMGSSPTSAPVTVDDLGNSSSKRLRAIQDVLTLSGALVFIKPLLKTLC